MVAICEHFLILIYTVYVHVIILDIHNELVGVCILVQGVRNHSRDYDWNDTMQLHAYRSN